MPKWASSSWNWRICSRPSKAAGGCSTKRTSASCPIMKRATAAGASGAALKARRSMPTASWCFIMSPRVSRLPKTMASAGAGVSRRPPSSIRSLPTRSRMRFADFLRSEFGVQTIGYAGWRFGRIETDDSKENESGAYALHTLGEDETIARLASGIKRFKLPDEFNFIKMYQQVAANSKTEPGRAALQRLATEFREPAAISQGGRLLASSAGSDSSGGQGQPRLCQGGLGADRGQLGPLRARDDAAGRSRRYGRISLPQREQVEFTAHEVLIEKLLDDVKAYIKSRPSSPDWRKINIGDIGYRLVIENQKQYVGRQVAQWQLPLEPRSEHFDKRITVATPLEKAGAYLLTAKMKDGNTSYIVIFWLTTRPSSASRWRARTTTIIADAPDGMPVANAKVEFFGWRQRWQPTGT